ncbi:hypothetical protein [Isobaculum melis]|uniref:Permuted papain-like amidase enzyme, YaeF/YiiX, C92 family n=1 Tax=Isobaculum melis TaxID=142588 RepID=A0A1H9SU82_9LACT|nr:hypothetical protein [Isobaculum melis]SER88405.1 hypothetical protein SAMN04488559_10942 [Isobaculum melis]
MKKIYIVLTKTNSQFGRLIRCYTKRPYNHASISLDSDLEMVFSFGRKNPTNPFKAGFVQEQLRNNPFFKNSVTAIMSVEVTEAQYQSLENRMQHMFHQKENYYYSIRSVVSVMFSKNFTEGENGYICSTFVADMLKTLNIEVSGKPVYTIKPYDFIEAPTLTMEFQGSLEEYLA